VSVPRNRGDPVEVKARARCDERAAFTVGEVALCSRPAYDRAVMRLQIYQVDAFTDRLFGGNPAAVVPLERWLDDATMQSIGLENNLAETAFFVPEGKGFRLRWFTPEVEVKLCGHATLASAYVLFNIIEPGRREVQFETLSGPLTVVATADRLVMDFPRWKLAALAAAPRGLADALRAVPSRVFSTGDGRDVFAVFEREADVRALAPEFGALRKLGVGVIATAPGTRSDCVVRYFAPAFGIDEDPGTGSIQCALVPYWSERLGKRSVHSLQISKRRADLYCELTDERVRIAGQAVKYLEGWIEVDTHSPGIAARQGEPNERDPAPRRRARR
jgi:PhzF family phenazine biosynthesis protein